MSSNFENLETRLVLTDNASVFWSDLSLAVQILLPLALAALLFSKKFSVQPLQSYVSAFWPSVTQKQRLLTWLSDRIPYMSSVPKKISQYWKEGSLLCTLINTSIPGACPNPQRHWKQPPVHAQALAYKYFGVEPVLTTVDFAEKKLSMSSETKFVNYLLAVQKAIVKISIDTDALKFTNSYIARGMGLIVGEQNKTSTFYLYPNADSQKLDNVFISIKGPYSSYGKQMISSNQMSKNAKRLAKMRKEAESERKKLAYRSDPQKYFFKPISFDIGPILGYLSRDGRSGDILIRVDMERDRAKITFVPKHSGIYELLLTSNDDHIHGSPFTIRVTKPCVDDQMEPKGGKVKEKRKVVAKNIDFIDESVDITEENKVFLKLDQNNNQKGREGNVKNEKIEAIEIIQINNREGEMFEEQPIRVIVGDSACVQKQNISNEEKEKEEENQNKKEEKQNEDHTIDNNDSSTKPSSVKTEQLPNNRNELPKILDSSKNEAFYFEEDKEFEKIYQETISDHHDTLTNFDTAISDLCENLTMEGPYLLEKPPQESETLHHFQVSNLSEIEETLMFSDAHSRSVLENEENSRRSEERRRRFKMGNRDDNSCNDDLRMIQENRDNVMKENFLMENRWKVEESRGMGSSKVKQLGMLTLETGEARKEESRNLLFNIKPNIEESIPTDKPHFQELNLKQSKLVDETSNSLSFRTSKNNENPPFKINLNDFSELTTEIEETFAAKSDVSERSSSTNDTLYRMDSPSSDIEDISLSYENQPSRIGDPSFKTEGFSPKIEDKPPENEGLWLKIDDRASTIEHEATRNQNHMTKILDRSMNIENLPLDVEDRSSRNQDHPTNIHDRSLEIEDRSFEDEDHSTRMREGQDQWGEVEDQSGNSEDRSSKIENQPPVENEAECRSFEVEGFEDQSTKTEDQSVEIEDQKHQTISKIEDEYQSSQYFSTRTENLFTGEEGNPSTIVDQRILNEDLNSATSQIKFTSINERMSYEKVADFASTTTSNKKDEIVTSEDEDTFIMADEGLSGKYEAVYSEILSRISEDDQLESKLECPSEKDEVAPLKIPAVFEEKKADAESEDENSMKTCNDSGFISCTTDEDSPFPTSRSIKNMVELFESNKPSRDNVEAKTSPISHDIAREVDKARPEKEDSALPSEEVQISDDHQRSEPAEDDISAVNVFEMKLKFERKIQDSIPTAKKCQFSSANRSLTKKSKVAFTQSMPNLAVAKDEYEKESFLSSADSTNEFVMQFKEKKLFWDKLAESGSGASLASNYSDVDNAPKWKMNDHKHAINSTRSLSSVGISLEHLKSIPSGTVLEEQNKRQLAAGSNGVLDRIRVFEKDFDSERHNTVLKRTKDRSLRSFPSFKSVKSAEGLQDIHDLMHDQPVEEDLQFAEESRRRFENARHFFRSIEQINLIGKSTGTSETKSDNFERKSPRRSVSLKVLNVQDRFALDNLYRDVIFNKIRNGSLMGSPNRDGVVGTLASISSTESGLEKDFGDEDDIDLGYFRIAKKSKRRKSVRSLFDVNY